MRKIRTSLAAIALLCCVIAACEVCLRATPTGELNPLAKPVPPAGPERILHFHSEIAVHDDLSVTVTESIRVVALGKEIKRGIYRDFPVQHQRKDGTNVVVPFEVAAVLKDGKPEPYHVVNRGRCKRVYMGGKNIFLKPGVYTYTLVYRTGKQVILKGDKCELYWNVTGNEWTFEIARASARLKIPTGAPAGKIRYAAYTGPKGAKGKAWKGRIDNGGRICFTTTGKLKKGEGLTISVTWPSNIVPPPN